MMASFRSSSRGWEPATAVKVDITVAWGGRQGRKLSLHSAELPMHVLASLLRSVKTSQPATRRQRRPGGRPGGRKGEGCKRKRQEARQDKCHTKLSPSAEEFRSTPPPTSLQFFYNKPMKSYPYCPPLPSGPEPTGPFKIVSYSSVDNGATAVGGTDDGAEGKDERGSESDTKVVPKVKKVQLMVQMQRLVLLWWRRLLRWQRRWRLRLPCKLLSWS